jgi:hypothetical protein
MTAKNSNTTWEKLSNPLLLLIIGAVISGILIPYFTRQWQDHQKDLELKTDLVSGISKAIVDLMLAAQLIETKTSPIITNQSYDLAG